MPNRLALLPKWAIYSEDPASWPQSPGRVFVPSAVGALLETLFETPIEQVYKEMSDQELSRASNAVEGFPHSAVDEAPCIVDFFERLIVDGDLTTYVRPFGRTGAQRLDADAWDHDNVREMIATGACSRPTGANGPPTHWVFLREAEVEAILACYRSQVHGPGNFGLLLELERRLDAILGSLRGVPDVSGRLPQEDATPLLARFPSARIELNSADIERLVYMASDWLEKQFAKEGNAQRSRVDFEEMAIEAFQPLMNGKRFGRVWERVTAQERHLHRKEPGRPKKRASRG